MCTNGQYCLMYIETKNLKLYRLISQQLSHTNVNSQPVYTHHPTADTYTYNLLHTYCSRPAIDESYSANQLTVVLRTSVVVPSFTNSLCTFSASLKFLSILCFIDYPFNYTNRCTF